MVGKTTTISTREPCRCGKCIYCEFGGNPPAKVTTITTTCENCANLVKLLERSLAVLESCGAIIENRGVEGDDLVVEIKKVTETK